jgi:serine/threonine protein kinase
MPLSAGDKLGPYEILSKIGAGGMGEVYRARDPRLGRDIAIQVPPNGSANALIATPAIVPPPIISVGPEREPGRSRPAGSRFGHLAA